MIVSHKHKFIFFKSRKTAGSSIQVSLAKHCGPEDIITGQYRLGIDDNSHSAGLNMDKFYTNHPHPQLVQTKKFLGPEVWNNYFKFSFVRNPFDIAVSRYHWNLKGKDNNLSTSIEGFEKWVEQGNLLREDSLSLYTCDNDKIDLDFIGYYETLEDDLDYICQKIGIPNVNLPTLKSGFRDSKNYTNFYNENTKNIVSTFYQNDINTFNYSFKPDFYTKNPKSIINSSIAKDNNINGPSIIKVPDFIQNKLGDYYLYFAHHDGKHIKLAYSNNLEGPWTLYKEGTLQLADTECITHIASPDVHVVDNQIVMYYHGDTEDGQHSFKALSSDGINFNSINKKLGSFYFRVFDYLGETYSIAKNGNTDGIIYKKDNNKFIPQFNLIDNIRHSAVYVDNNILYIFHSIVGEAPESLYIAKIKNWEIISNYKFKEPKYDWEGAEKTKTNSRFGASFSFVNELRDPCIFEEEDNLYLLYSYGGESGIAISKLVKNEN